MGWPKISVTATEPLFFYGTLCHLPLLQAVLGQKEIPYQTGVLHDYAVYWAQGENYPVLKPEHGAQASGILVELSAQDISRLDFYEGAFSYILQIVKIETSRKNRTARTYIADREIAVGAIWVLDDWEAKFARVNTRAAHEIMSYHGDMSRKELQNRFSQIHARAAAFERMVDRNTLDHRQDRSADIAISDARRPYSQFFTLEEHDLSVRQFDGTMSAQMTRAGFVAGDASIVLPFDPVRQRVLLVEQFRYGAFLAGDSDPWSWEPIAGRIDLGETAEQAAHREAVEEAGITLQALHVAARCYPTPGISNEFHHIFVGVSDLPDDVVGVGGKEDEQEDIRSHIATLSELETLLDEQSLRNAPLVIAANWLLRHHKNL